ncbi:MAG: GWxTD domain-containing protein [Flavobacteriales bacterium]|nr:GWxTD domain-containing protein [Flavobacteriales bacterium]
MHFKLLFIVLSLFCIANCTGPKNISNINLSYLYEEGSLIHPEFQAYHISSIKSRLFIKLKSNEFLHTKELNEKNFSAKIKIKIEVLNSYESSEIIDSSSIFIKHFGSNEDIESIIESIDFSAAMNGRYLLRISISDTKRRLNANFYKSLNKYNKYESNNFHVSKTAKGATIFNDFINSNEPIGIKYEYENTDTLYIKEYKRKLGFASPPFSLSPIKKNYQNPDTSYFILKKSLESFQYTATNFGLYHFTTKRDTIDGLTLFNFTKNFPEISNISEMIEPLRYITTKEEFQELKGSLDKKLAMDNFWISLGKDPSISKTLIKRYYRRVEKSNKVFSAEIEGWRTDRGLLYIVLGPPKAIYRTNDTETWIYGDDQNIEPLNFTFVKHKNKFTNSDYKLIRKPIYKNIWMTATSSWRQGRVFNAK